MVTVDLPALEQRDTDAKSTVSLLPDREAVSHHEVLEDSSVRPSLLGPIIARSSRRRARTDLQNRASNVCTQRRAHPLRRTITQSRARSSEAGRTNVSYVPPEWRMTIAGGVRKRLIGAKGSRGYLSSCTSQESTIPFLLEYANPWSRSRAADASRLAMRDAHLVPSERWRARVAPSAGIKIDSSQDSQDRAKRVENSRLAVACFHGI